jgi:tetratricopeptide (TPR) repeat protein
VQKGFRERALAINREKVYDGAMKLLAQSKFDKAVVELEKIIAEDPNDVRTLLKIAETLHVKMGRRREALERYDRAATLYAEQGFFLKAVAVFKQMLTVDATNPDLILRLAEMHQQLGYGSQSMQHYQQAVVLFEQQGRGREALAVLKRMVDLDPENLQPRVKVAELFAQQGMFPEAAAEMRAAYVHLRDQQRLDDAIRCGDRVVQWDPTALDIARELAALHMQRGDARSALAKLEFCFKANPHDVEVLGLIAAAFLATDQVAKAVSVFREMARIHESQADADNARAAWEKVLEHAPGDEQAETALGRRAVAPAPAAPRVNPEDEQLNRLLTETDVYVKYGLRDKAIEHLDKIFAIRPDHLPALEKLKTLQVQTKQVAAAIGTLQRLVVVGGESGHPKVADWQAELERLQKGASPAPRAPAPPAPRPTAQDDDLLLAVDDRPPPPRASPAPKSAAMLRGGAPRPAVALDEPLDELLDQPIEDRSDARPPRGPSPPPFVDDGDEPFDDVRASPLPADEPLVDDALAGAGEDVAVAPRSSSRGDDTGAFDIDAVEGSREGAGEIAPAAEVEHDAAAFLVADEAAAPPTLPPDDAGFDDNDLDALAAAAVREATASRSEVATTSPPMVTFSADEVGSAEGFSVAAAGEQRVDENDAAGFDDAVAPPVADEATAGFAPEAEDDGDFSEERTVAYDAAAAMRELRRAGAIAPAAIAPAEVTPPAADLGFDDGGPPSPFGSYEPSSSPLPDVTEEFNARDFAPAPDDGGADPSAAPGAVPSDAGVASEGSGPFGGDDDSFSPTATGTFANDASVGVYASVDADAIEEIGDEDVQETPFAAPPPIDDGGFDVPSQARMLFAPARGFEDDPANTFFADELAEAEFFLQQDLLDEARDVLTPILDEVPESARVQHMLARVAAKENGEPEPPAPWEQQLLQDVAAQLSELAALAPPRDIPSQPDQVSVEEVLSQFKRGVAETVAEDDAATHYDLGIAYREMGLLDDAVGEFEIAARAAQKAPDALYVIALVRSEQGRADDALAALERALQAPTATAAQRAAAEHQRGVVLDDQGRGAEALIAFSRSRALGGSADDLDRRIAALRAVHGDVDAL